MNRLLTIRELAECLGISPGTAYHWLSQGRLPCIRFSSRCVRFRESEIQTMLEELRQPGASPLESGNDAKRIRVRRRR
jgi:excisionase family DNA binding protein